MYAKLINGDIQTSPIQIEVNGFIIMNPSSEHLIPLGYKEVIYTDINEDMINPTPQYTETDTNIIVSYVEGEVVEELIDVEALRQAAYKSEADQYLIAYNGYMLEGKPTEAEEQKQLYLAKKEEIRLRYAETI